MVQRSTHGKRLWEILLVGMCLWAWSVPLMAQPPEPAPIHKTKSSETVSKSAEQRLSAKLDQVLANQQKILARFDEIMQELAIVKVRATPRQPR